MRIRMAAGSSTGRVRKVNQDNFILDGQSLPRDHGDFAPLSKVCAEERPLLVGVFDGMGGYAAGEEASYITAQTALALSGKPHAGAAELLTEICMEANRRVCAFGNGSPTGSTAAMLHLEGGKYTLCNIGDSPIFLLRERMLTQLSVDHTQRAMYERLRGTPAEPGRKFPLTQHIGIPEEELLIEPYLAGGPLKPGDTFLLCSDGVTDLLTREEILTVLFKEPSPHEMVRTLIRRAMDAGGRDNITAVCVQVESGKNPLLRLFRK